MPEIRKSVLNIRQLYRLPIKHCLSIFETIKLTVKSANSTML